MITMDVFHQDAFSAISMTAAVQKIGYVPGFLRAMPGLVQDRPVRTLGVYIEERSHAPALIHITERGTPFPHKGRDKRKMRNFETTRIALQSKMRADEVQGIRAFGSETELEAIMTEVAMRQAEMRTDMQLTEEYHLLNLIDGTFKDTDGSTIYDWCTELSQSRQSVIDFDLDNASPANNALRQKIVDMQRKGMDALFGIGGNAVQWTALCGDNFYDNFSAHKEVRERYLNTPAAATSDRIGAAYQMIDFGGMSWWNYRGTDSMYAKKKVGIPTDECRIFPLGAGIFQWVLAPAEGMQYVNTLGQKLYSWVLPDVSGRDAHVEVEIAQYPLPVCIMPGALFRGKRT